MHVGIGRQRVSDEAEGLRGRIGKEGPPCPRLLLAEVQIDPCEGDFPDAEFGGVTDHISSSGDVIWPYGAYQHGRWQDFFQVHRRRFGSCPIQPGNGSVCFPQIFRRVG
jgi:hypothetical protein